MPDIEDGQEPWQPRRGSVFKIAVWLLLALIALGVLAGLVTGLVL